MINTRDDFPNRTKEILKQRAAYICSNPSCKKMTIAPSSNNSDAVQFIGVCAHITAACEGGPRYDGNISSSDRSNIKNAIFLCANCATLIDKNNGIDYLPDTLIKWKNDHEKWVIQNLNKSNTETINLTSNNQMGGITANIVHLNNYPQKMGDEISLADRHDKELFLKAEAVLGEDQLLEILSTLEYNQSIQIDEIHVISAFIDFHSKNANEYLNKEVEANRKWLFNTLSDLSDFISYRFDKWPYKQDDDNFQVCLHPTTNCDRGGDLTAECFEKHDALSREMLKKIKKVTKEYAKFRRAIKESLYL